MLRKCYQSRDLFFMRSLLNKNKYSNTSTEQNLSCSKNLCKYLNISENKAEYMCVKYPVIKKLHGTQMKQLVQTLEDLGYNKEVFIQEPSLFSILPVTIKYRYKVLEECGFQKITPYHLVTYLPLVKKKTINDLKKSGDIPSHLNIENKLASYMTQWPTSLTNTITGNPDDSTAYNLRLKIIQRYLELVLDLNNDEFYRGVHTYPTIRHRPLQMINKTLTILLSEVMMPSYKIKSNLYLVHVDPENLMNILYKFRSIGGVDIKEILRMHPKLATKNYLTLMKIKNILKEHNISNEAQRRCFDIYTLGPTTINDRLEKTKQIPEFNAYLNHPRFLKMIHYNKNATKRLHSLYSSNKKCSSLNILSGSLEHYEAFVKAPGDRLGKGKDLIFCISQFLGDTYKSVDIRHKIKCHPFWINIPIIQVKDVFNKLHAEFSLSDIYDNCTILLYPWNKIEVMLNMIRGKSEVGQQFEKLKSNIDLAKLNKSQQLSLIHYLLEKDHYFSGNGVWTEEKGKSVPEQNSVPKCKAVSTN